MVVESFVKSRRGILEHLQQGRLSIAEFAVFQLLLLQADKATGVVWTASPTITTQFRNCDGRTIKEALAGLKRKGYIKSFQEQGSRSSYPVLINKYEITVGVLKGCLTNAEQTVDWRQPATSARPDDVVTPSSDRTDDRPPYSRPQEERPQDVKATRESEHANQPASDPAETPAVSRPKSETSYSKLSDVPREDQARILTSRIFLDLGSPKDKAKQLPQWRDELDPLCDQYEFPLLCEAVRWAITEDVHWPQYIRRAANVVKNAESIVDAYRAHLRGKATYDRAKKQAASTVSEKKQAPANYGGAATVELKGTRTL
jgi:hypothetical protein